MTPTKPKARLFVGDDLAPDGRLALSRDQTNYLANVLRVGPGDGVALFNGRDGEWNGSVETIAKHRCRLSVGEQRRSQAAEPGPWLAFSPLKKTQTDFLVEKATELGAERLCPVFTRRTNSARVNRNRLLARAVEASEQCERLTVPEITEPVDLGQMTRDWPRQRRLLVLDETGGGRPIADVLADWRVERDDGADAPGFLTGPEGGFERGELDALRELDFVTAVGLGRRVLRAETAALAAMACWQALLGDGG